MRKKEKWKPKIIGIVGIGGRCGRVVAAFFKEKGYKIIGCDTNHKTEYCLREVVEVSDVVVFAVPIRSAVEVITSAAQWSRHNQLFTDITSIKSQTTAAMLTSKAQVVGFHPMFGPTVSPHGETIVQCVARLTDKAMRQWIKKMLASTGAVIKKSHGNGRVHDTFMFTVQVAPHTANLLNAVLMARSHISIRESLTYSSPFHKVMLSLMGRMLNSNNDEMYASIILENSNTLKFLRERVKLEQELIGIVERKDYDALMELFQEARWHFGPAVIRDSNELFEKIIGVLKK